MRVDTGRLCTTAIIVGMVMGMIGGFSIGLIF
nr:MAG TPA: YtxH-like protein [Caudoviricetes sp.]